MKKLFLALCSTALLLNACRKPGLESTSGTNTASLKKSSPDANSNERIYRLGDNLYDVLGWGYDVTGEWAHIDQIRGEVINVAQLLQDYPARVISESGTNSWEWKTESGSEASSYSSEITHKMDANFNIPIFKGILKSSFQAENSSTHMFDASYVYSTHDLILKYKRLRFNAANALLQNYVTAEFLDDLNNWYANDIPGFVRKYGTHVCANFDMGAKMDVVYQATTRNESRKDAASGGIKTGVDQVFGVGYTVASSSSYATSNKQKKLWIRCRGGEPNQGPSGIVDLEAQTVQPLSYANWQSSVNAATTQLIDFSTNDGLIPLYELIADPAKKAAVQSYITQYLIDNQVYLEYKSEVVYSYYAPSTGDHYYTLDQKNYGGYNLEGGAFQAFSYQVPNSVRVYSFYNGRDHFYSTSSANPGGSYVLEGNAFWAFSSPQTGTTPVYRFYNRNSGDHYYKHDPAVPGGYVSEGIAFHAF